jgi:hypothetical protein
MTDEDEEVPLMKSRTIIIAAIMIFALCLGPAFAAEKAPENVVNLAKGELAKLGSDPAIIKAVQAENAKNKALDQIKAMDEKWKADAGVADYMKALMESECGQYLRKIQDEKPYLAEIFVMDNQGANVAMTDKTSDYWQGDEAKFTESFKGGAGAVHISDVEFDDSTQVYVVQASVPVMDGGKAIGAITFGIDVDKVE